MDRTTSVDVLTEIPDAAVENTVNISPRITCQICKRPLSRSERFLYAYVCLECEAPDKRPNWSAW